MLSPRAWFAGVWFLALSAALPAQSEPKLELAPLFGDHMVLPPGTEVVVRGRGTPDRDVLVDPSWGDAVRGRVAADGRFAIAIPTPARGTKASLVVRSHGLEKVCDDILIGDVWLASGQSNMEMSVGAAGGWQTGVVNEKQEIENADHPTLRVFTVTRQTSDQPSEVLTGHWQVCTPEVANSFSAAGYFFARDLVRAGKGPIGLVVSSWGGTRCEAWTRGVGLGGFPEFREQLAALGSKAGSLDEQRERFFAAIDAKSPGSERRSVTLPARWAAEGLADLDGVVEYRRTVAVPVSFRNRTLRLQLGPIDDMDTVLWNGVRVAGSEREGMWSTPRDYVVDAMHTDCDTVELCVRVIDTGGAGGLGGKPDQMRIWVKGGDRAAGLPLAGRWTRTVVAAMADLPPWPRSGGGPNRPSVLWNGMIAPLLPFPFTGCIWYQGESNRNKAEQYRTLFPAMIRGWRAAFGREVPFYFVQIAPFGYRNDAGETAALRDAQAVALDLPKTGMVVTLDCGNARDIHPKQKQPVGARLALLARKHHYGDHVVCSGPRVIAASRHGDQVTLRMEDATEVVQLRNGGAGFELAGPDGVFHVAEANIEAGTVRLSSKACPEPRAVRYAWSAVPKWSLVNAAGLPGQPFALPVK